MDFVSPSRLLEKSPFKDITNATPTVPVGGGSPCKMAKSRTKRTASTINSPQRRSTRLSSLKSEPEEKEEIDEEPQTAVKTRSRRKVTPGGSVTSRKRGAKKDAQEGDTTVRRRTRSSISTIPSSPLAGKATQPGLATPTRPRLTRSTSMSAKTEASATESQSAMFPVINESHEETEGNMSPLGKYQITRQLENRQYIPSPSPFKQYPLPHSPVKTALTPRVAATPVQRQSPLPPFPTIKSLLGENDVFAISPGMFPRKTKRVDYLDILADAERTEFISPVKSSHRNPSTAADGASTDTPMDAHEEQTSVSIRDNVVESTAVDNVRKDDALVEAEEPLQRADEHPHFELLTYLAEVASGTDQLHQDETPVEDFEGGSIEDILTAAALAESLKDELLTAVDEESPCKENVDDTSVEDPAAERVSVETEPVEAEPVESEPVEPVLMESETEQAEPAITTQEIEPVTATIINEDPVLLEHPSLLSDQNPPEMQTKTVNEAASTVCRPVQMETTIVNVDNPAEHEQDDIPDWDSLISFSEADDTNNNFDDAEPTHDVHISLGMSIRDAIDELNNQEANGDEDLSVSVPQSATFTLDGHASQGTINIFQDVISEDDILTKVPSARQSLDNNSVIFSFPTEQALITSPPKRPLSTSTQDNFGTKKRKTGPVLPNTTRLDILRKRATRVRSRETRHNLKRRDITTALQSVFDNLPSPPPQISILKETVALIPPGLALQRVASPVTPVPTKRRREEEMSLGKSPSPAKPASTRKVGSPKKHFVIRPSPVKETPRAGFGFMFGEKKTTVEQIIRPTPRYEVYSKIFGPPPQLSKTLVDKDTTTTLKTDTFKNDTVKNDTSIPVVEEHHLKSPSRKRRVLDDTRTLKSRKDEPISNLGRPVRNESFAVPIVPIPPGPPQLPPSIQRNNTKRFPLNTSVLPSPAQPPPSVVRSSLPRPSGVFGSTSLPVPARRSTRQPKASVTTPIVAPTSKVNTTTNVGQHVVPPVEKKDIAGSEKHMSDVTHPVNVTMDRPKGKLGGAQRVNRNGDTTKKIEVSNRPTRPPTPPLTSLSQKELKSLTDANTKKNEGFKMVNLQPFVKRVNKKRPAEASDEFMVGKGGKWTKQEALPEWDHECTEEGKIRWKSPRFMAKTERRGAMRVKGILKRRERERMDKEEESTVTCEPLVIQRFLYKGEKA